MPNKRLFTIPYGLPKDVALQAVQDKWPSVVIEELEGSERNFYLTMEDTDVNHVVANAVTPFLEGVLWYYDMFQSTITKTIRELALNRDKQTKRRTKP